MQPRMGRRLKSAVRWYRHIALANGIPDRSDNQTCSVLEDKHLVQYIDPLTAPQLVRLSTVMGHCQCAWPLQGVGRAQ